MKKTSVVDMMIDYMNEKYDDHFEYAEPFGGKPGDKTKQILVKSEKYPDAKIWVEHYSQNGDDAFADNYVSYKYENQTREALQSLLMNVFGSEVKVSYTVGLRGLRNNFTDNTSFEQYITDPASMIVFRAFVLDNGSAVSKGDNDLKKAIDESGFVLFGTVYVTDNRDYYDEAFDLSYIEQSKIMALEINMSAPHEFLTFKWR